MSAPAILSQREREQYNHEGFIYVKDRGSKDGTKLFWRCEKKDHGKNGTGNRTYCPGRIWTNIEDGSFHSLRTAHTCSNAGSAAHVEIAQVTTMMKKKAKETFERPAEIRTSACQHISNSALGLFPTRDAVRKVISRVRSDNTLPNPRSRQEMEIPLIYQQYEAGNEGQQEKFLLADSGVGDEHRIVVFGREYHQTWSGQMREVFMDGTFLLTPPLFTQIFVILARRGLGHGFVFPVLFCLLPDKLQRSYIKLFRIIKMMWPDFSPDAISVDFEIGIHQALREEFPEVNIRGCFFHLVQNLRKHLSSTELLRRYNTDSNFALNARMITSLAFVPEVDIEHALTILEEHLPAELEPVLSWFINTYVGRLRNNGTRASPLFPFQIWSVQERTLSGSDRTNNFAEACHKRLQQVYGVAHPNIWKFVAKLKKIQKSFDVDYERFVAGYEAPRKRTRYEEADRRILNKVENYDRNEIIEYLRGLSHNYRMN